MFHKIACRLKTNWKSGITTALVSIPLSISLAVASNSTPIAGIITAIWAGLTMSILGGSHYNIVGPTGALSGILATYAILHGPGSLPMLAIIAGVFILLAYLLKFERYLIFIPYSVIHGFTLGVAFIIGLNQLNFALGLTGIPKHSEFIENVLESFKYIDHTSAIPLFIFLFSLAALFIFKKFTPKLPGAIILSPIGIFIGYLADKQIIHVQIETLGNKFGDIAAYLTLKPHLYFETPMLITGATVAVIAILETMLSAKIADGMTKTKHDSRREIIGLSIANIISGLSGGIPATAALARTSLNIKTGADSKVSAMINSITIAIISLLFFSYFKFIPMAVIAAILVFIAIQMVEAEHFFKFFRYDKKGLLISALVALATILKNPIVGILLGVTLALLLFVERLSHGQFELSFNKKSGESVVINSDESLKEIKENTDILLYSFKGKLAYINSRAHVARFETNLKKYKNIILRFREVYFIDLDGVDAFDEIVEILQRRSQIILITGIAPHLKNFLCENSLFFKNLEEKGLVFDKATQALRTLGINS